MGKQFRIMGLAIGFICMAVVLSTQEGAAQPTSELVSLTTVAPRVWKRGQPLVLAVQGKGLTNETQLCAPFPVQVKNLSATRANWQAEITVPPEVAIGVWPVWWQHPVLGPSLPIAVVIADWPCFQVRSEGQEPNRAAVNIHNPSEPIKPQALPEIAFRNGSAWPIQTSAVFAGQLRKRDIQRWLLPPNCSVSVEVLTRRLGDSFDPALRLRSLTGQFLAEVEDTPGLAGDCQLVCPAHATPTVLELFDTTHSQSGDFVVFIEVQAPDAKTELGLPAVYVPIAGLASISRRTQFWSSDRSFPLTTATWQPQETVWRQRCRVPESVWPRAGLPAPWLAVCAAGVAEENCRAFQIDSLEKRADTYRLELTPGIQLIHGMFTSEAVHRFQCQVAPQSNLFLATFSAEFGAATDLRLQVRRLSAGQPAEVLGQADDSQGRSASEKEKRGTSQDPQLSCQVPAETSELLLEVENLSGVIGPTATYSLQIEVNKAASPATNLFQYTPFLTTHALSVAPGEWRSVDLVVEQEGKNNQEWTGYWDWLPAGWQTTIALPPLDPKQTKRQVRLLVCPDSHFQQPTPLRARVIPAALDSQPGRQCSQTLDIYEWPLCTDAGIRTLVWDWPAIWAVPRSHLTKYPLTDLAQPVPMPLRADVPTEWHWHSDEAALSIPVQLSAHLPAGQALVWRSYAWLARPDSARPALRLPVHPVEAAAETEQQLDWRLERVPLVMKQLPADDSGMVLLIVEAGLWQGQQYLGSVFAEPVRCRWLPANSTNKD